MTTKYHEPDALEEVRRIRAEVYRKFVTMSPEEWAQHERESAERLGLKIASPCNAALASSPDAPNPQR